jgi:hypothetical protein
MSSKILATMARKSGTAHPSTAEVSVGRVARPIWRQEPAAMDRVWSVPFGRDEIA